MAPPQKKPLLKPFSAKKSNALPGRPVSNVGKYLLKPTPEAPSGVEMLNTQPDLLQQVQEQYLKVFQLPPSLQPKYLRKPAVMDKRRGQAISKGWRAPRSLH